MRYEKGTIVLTKLPTLLCSLKKRSLVQIMKISTVIKFVFSILPPLAIGAISGFYTSKAIPVWYASLNQPSFNPPNWLFGPVWSTLYILMGISFFMIWQLPASEAKRRAFQIYFIQLALNFAWSFLFFFFKNIGLALIEIMFLLLSIATMLFWFHRVKPLASFINIPYLLWVTFATCLNAAYYVLNH